MTTTLRVTRVKSGFMPDALTCATLCYSPSRPTSRGTDVPTACLAFPALFLRTPSSAPLLQDCLYPQETTLSLAGVSRASHCLTATSAPRPHLVRSSDTIIGQKHGRRKTFLMQRWSHLQTTSIAGTGQMDRKDILCRHKSQLNHT